MKHPHNAPLIRLLIMALALGVTTSALADSGDAGEAAATLKANITPIQAVRIAQSESHGRAFGMGMEVNGKKHGYEVQLDVHGHPMLGRVAPDSGRWLGMKPAHGEDAQGMDAMKGHAIGLIAAMQAATHSHPGRPLEAGPAGTGAHTYYAVDVVRSDGAIVHVRVNPDSGHTTRSRKGDAD